MEAQIWVVLNNCDYLLDLSTQILFNLFID